MSIPAIESIRSTPEQPREYHSLGWPRAAVFSFCFSPRPQPHAHAPSVRNPRKKAAAANKQSSESHLSVVRWLLLLAGKSVPLGGNTLLSPLAGSLGLCALGVHLCLELLLTGLLGLGLVDLRRLSVCCAVMARSHDVNVRARQGHACA